jgi:sensor c-di-GMP phosphodiesterase-like protein
MAVVIMVAGWATALVLVLATLAALEVSEQRQRHDQTLEEIERLMADGLNVLHDLNTEVSPDCEPASLDAMRAFVFASPYVRDIGVLDDQLRLICTTTRGKLNPPLGYTPGVRIMGRDGTVREMWVDTPLIVRDGRVSASVVRHGSFNVVIDPYATDRVYQRGASLFWARLDSEDYELVSNFKALSHARRAAMRDLVGRGEGAALLLPSHGMWAVSSPAGSGALWVQSFTTIEDVLAHRLDTFALWVTVLALIAALGFMPLLQHLRYRFSVAGRIEALLVPRNVVCMFQPIIDLQTQQVAGCEVLMRLRDGDDLLTPDKFMAVVIGKKLTWALDRAVLQQAMADLASLGTAVRVLKVALNLFPENVRFEALHGLVQAGPPLAQRHWQIGFEVTEQNYSPQVLTEVAALKQAGYPVSVDDFGTGYSNLGSVRNFAPDVLKIDRSFVMVIQDDSVRSSLVPEIVAIARAVGADVVAEGVELPEQAARLQALGVRYAQGYLYSRPLVLEAWRGWLKERELLSKK